MYSSRIQYALDNFFEENYFLKMSNFYQLHESSDLGKGSINVSVNGDNLCLCDFDTKNKCNFVKSNKTYGMKKSSDHLIFQFLNNKWTLHIIEMKTSVGNNLWLDIKQKTRASYLTALAISEFLGLNISGVFVYTSYEFEKFGKNDSLTDPSALKAMLGKHRSNYKTEEWDNNIIRICIDEIVEFPHIPIKMIRNKETNSLEGILNV